MTEVKLLPPAAEFVNYLLPKGSGRSAKLLYKGKGEMLNGRILSELQYTAPDCF